jgi:hypothetical protein
MSAAPTQYTRVNNFVSDATNNPSITVAGIATDLDAEYEAIRTSVNQTISRLNEIQRADGKLRSNVLDPTEYTAITAAVSGATNAASSATAAASSAASASTSATTATNRAAEATTAASNVAGYVTTATQKATAAAASATAAATSEANALSSSTNANTKATAAATSATSASNSATTASTKATEAAASAAGAASSASTASTKATEAAASAASVAGQATTATNAATSATSSAATATTRANNAADSAVSAQNSATIATTKAAEAALSALDANTAKTLAVTKAAEAVTTVATLNSANAATLTNANNAAASATEAATSAMAASISRSAAATSATGAETSATNAATSATDANTALASVNLIFDTFDDRFLGSKTSDPTVDNDGNAILAGAVYYNSTTKDVRFFNGVTWDSPNASATSSATASAASATAAATSATNAATSATNAATSATNAATSATGAATSAANAAASYDNFDDRYLGPKATAPTVDNDGSALLVGALYWSTSGPSANKMMAWTGSAWNEAFTGEPAIPTGTTSQFWRGDKTWQTIPSPLATALTGLSTATSTAAVAADTILVGIGKLQAQITSAATNLASNVRSTALTGLSTATSTAVTAADTIWAGIGKLQAQITSAATSLASNVRGTVLTGLSTTTATEVADTDTILVGIGKLQAQVSNAVNTLNPTNSEKILSFSIIDLTSVTPSVTTDGTFFYRQLYKVNHGLASGDTIYITGQTGNNAIFNGTWQIITVADANTIYLTGDYAVSPGPGPFVALSASCTTFGKRVTGSWPDGVYRPIIRRTAAGIYHIQPDLSSTLSQAVVFAKSSTPSTAATSASTFATFCDVNYAATNLWGNASPTLILVTRNASGVATNYTQNELIIYP